MSQFAIRVATPADAASILATHKASVAVLCAGHYSPEHMDSWFRDRGADIYAPAIERQRLWLVEAQGKVRGFVGFEPGEVTLLFVSPEASGKKLGSALFEFGLARAREDATAAVFVLATKNSVSFYARHGFEVEEEQSFVRGTGNLHYPVLRMKRPSKHCNLAATFASDA